MLNKILIRPKSLLLIFISVLLLVAITVVYELRQSRQEALSILKSQAHSLLETILISSQEVLTASEEVESEINKRLLNNAQIIKLLLERNKLDNKILREIAASNKLHRINVFSNGGELLYSSFERGNKAGQGEFVRKYLSPIFNGEKDTLIIGLKESRMQQGYRYVTVLSTDSDGAIVINMDAEQLLEFRGRIGFGILLNRMTENEGVIYTALEDSSGILAASGNVKSLDNIVESDFLSESIENKQFNWRFTDFNGTEIFEAVHPFDVDDETIGLFRIGLSLAPLNVVNERITNRIILIGILLLVLGTVLLVLVFYRQNFDILRKQYQYMEGFAHQLINNANDIIIVLNRLKQIKEINPAGEKFFELSSDQIKNYDLNKLLCEGAENQIFNTSSQIIETTCLRGEEKKHLLLSRSSFEDSEKELFYVLIIRDLTSIKELEQQIERGKQLTAMGNLASGVAHEIRNPLNAIGTIIQQLGRDFEPTADKEEYYSFTKLVYNEVKRINKTIESFLKLAKPEPIVRKHFILSEFLKDIELQHKRNLEDKNINLIVENYYEGEVFWDEDQIKQVLINLISNAGDAIVNTGEIKITAKQHEDNIIVVVADNGNGIAEENIGKIFNLYFTTKAEGSGIGLGIIQRIINEHGGIISVDSKISEGTKFTIKLKQE
ncbi:MAG: PAS domain S-box protein [Bacteroidetes bacterium]|nr:PAS domain S-box protein [Bacteroidota bacterium]